MFSAFLQYRFKSLGYHSNEKRTHFSAKKDYLCLNKGERFRMLRILRFQFRCTNFALIQLFRFFVLSKNRFSAFAAASISDKSSV